MDKNEEGMTTKEYFSAARIWFIILSIILLTSIIYVAYSWWSFIAECLKWIVLISLPITFISWFISIKWMDECKRDLEDEERQN